MLPPVFYVQQLEQILLQKLLSPPTPAARPLRFLPAPRRALISVFSFFVRFFRAKPCPFGLVCLRCAPDAHQYSVFSFFLFPSTRISAGFMIFSYGENTSNHL